MPRYTRCPYYQSEKRQTISCEDTCRRFKSLKDKWVWMDKYCDADYERCPYAAEITKAYSELEEGDIRALDKEKIGALGKENQKLLSALGRAEKRVERQQKKIDELRAVNRSYVQKYDDLEQKRRVEYSKRRSAEEGLRKANGKILDELAQLSAIYEQRMAYLIETYAPDGKLMESMVEEWAGDRSFALVHDTDDDGEIYWKVVFEDVKDKRSENVQKPE